MNAVKELNNLMLELEGKDKIEAHQTDLMFDLNNNHFFPDLKEWTKGCSACRERVYNRLRDLWLNNYKNK